MAKIKSQIFFIFLLAAIPTVLAAQQAASIPSSPGNAISGGSYAVNVKVKGLGSGDEVRLTNGADVINATSDGRYKFPILLQNSAKYSVVAATPYAPDISCTATNPAGVIVGASVTVQVSCTPKAQSVHVQNVNSQAGGQAELDDNGGNSSQALSVGSGNGSVASSVDGEDNSPSLSVSAPGQPSVQAADNFPTLDTSGNDLSGDNLALPAEPSAQAKGSSFPSLKSQLANQPAGQNASQGVQPMGGTHETTLWNCYSVDDPQSKNGFTEITGINMLGVIVGNINSPLNRQAFIAAPTEYNDHGVSWVPSYVKFSPISVSGAQKVIVKGMNEKHFIGGIYKDTAGLEHGWTHSKTGVPKDFGSILVTGLSSVFSTQNVVGQKTPWVDPGDDTLVGYDSSTKQAYYMSFATATMKMDGKQILAFPPNITNAIPTSIGSGIPQNPGVEDPDTAKMGIVGNSDQGMWYYDHGSPNAQYVLLNNIPLWGHKFQAREVDFQKDVGGIYIDKSGATQGFILYHATGKQDWVPFQCANNEMNGLPKGVTVKDIDLNSFMAKHDMAGSFMDSEKHTHGFVATPAN